jgi:hypothetical protein
VLGALDALVCTGISVFQKVFSVVLNRASFDSTAVVLRSDLIGSIIGSDGRCTGVAFDLEPTRSVPVFERSTSQFRIQEWDVTEMAS